MDICRLFDSFHLLHFKGKYCIFIVYLLHLFAFSPILTLVISNIIYAQT